MMQIVVVVVFFKQMIIETFLISQNMEKSRIRISGKYSLSYQTVPYSHHISSVYSHNTQIGLIL